MKFYSVGYSSWESCPKTILCHNMEFTENEFHDMVIDVYYKVYENKILKYKDDLSSIKESDEFASTIILISRCC